MSKREREYKRKRQEEQEAAAHVFQDFIETFQNPTSTIGNKTFVRSGVLYSEKNDENVGQIYQPKPVIKQEKVDISTSAIECAKILKGNVPEKTKKQEKPKSNLELLKEELKLRHSDCAEKGRLKEEFDLPSPALSYFEGGDPNSTNLFVANLRSNVTENHLMVEFGAFGPLASVKIMWPRGDEKVRNSNCGFVAFMSRKDAERALKANKNREDMRVGWGKSVEIPAHPIYIPNELLKHFLPPPHTGLPFNAQPPTDFKHPRNEEEYEAFLPFCSIKVTIPLNKKVLSLVHRMVEFVVREGPMFEAFIMNKELRNPDYNFLFDCQSPVHVYYRWKVFSILNGDCQKSWSMKKFRMFEGGSVWIPPTAINFADGMPEELIRKEDFQAETRLSETQCGRLIDLIRNLSMQRSKIAEAMLFCMNHKSAIDDALEVIFESLTDLKTNPLKKIARLYLLSDIMHNCKSKRMKLKVDENSDEELLNLFKALRETHESIKYSADRNNFKTRIMRVLRHWDTYKLVSEDTLKKIETSFPTSRSDIFDDDNSSIDEPLDGANLLKRSLVGEMGPEVVTLDDPNWNRDQKTQEKNIMEYFVPSKWDTVDPEEVEAQAMSTEKLYYMELESKLKKSREDEKKRKKKKKKSRS
nr:U2 snRNP-associated SURP motif-containing protein-like [Leptinotarsa decemlineata]